MRELPGGVETWNARSIVMRRLGLCRLCPDLSRMRLDCLNFVALFADDTDDVSEYDQCVPATPVVIVQHAGINLDDLPIQALHRTS